MKNNEKNKNIYEEYTHEYTQYSLNTPEHKILGRFRLDWHKMRMLDIGVGTGRTSYIFSAITKTYLGVDYALNMIKKCKNIIGESEEVEFKVMDARDMSSLHKTPFDFVLFSLNGLDSVGNEDRIKILCEIRKILKPDGYFCFSTHTLNTLPFQKKAPVFMKNNIIASIRSLRELTNHILVKLRLKWIYRNVKADEIRKSNWYILKDGSHDFKIDIYHINPHYQVEQLEKAGFEIDTVYDKKGEVIDILDEHSGSWIYILCKPKSA